MLRTLCSWEEDRAGEQLTMLKQARLRADCFVLPAQNAAVP